MKIFAEGDLTASLEAQLTPARSEVRAEGKNRLLNVNEAEYIDYLEAKYRVETLSINWDEITVSEREEMIGAERFPGDFHVFQGKFYPKQILTYHVPFSGDQGLLKLTPSSRILWTTDVLISNGEILFDIINWRNDPTEVKRQADGILSNIRRQCENVQRQTTAWNDRLREELEGIVKHRKDELLRQSEFLQQLGVPIKPSQNVSSTFSVPVEKKKPVIRKPQSSDEPFKPEPALDQSIYESILRICEDMGREMERHPSVYHDKDEETLRDHFIMQLSPHFQSVSGETFNRRGKTDILIRHEGGNVFVAECKYWTGSKGLLQALDQLLSYLTWRDSKSALILFVRNKDFGAVLEKMRDCIASHACFMKLEREPMDGSLRYAFHLPEDESRGIHLAVLAFHFPD